MMNPQKMIRYDRKDRVTGETVRFYQHNSGFRIDIVQKKNYSNRYAGILVPFGADHVSYVDFNTGDERQIPLGGPYITTQGILQKEDSDSPLSRLNQLGINIELAMDRSSVTYSFTTVDHFGEAISALLELVLEARFSDEQITREIEKLGLERLLEEENLSTIAEEVLLRGLYKNPLIHTPIYGNMEGLMHLNGEDVESYYQNAYHPTVLTLVLVGHFLPDEEEHMINEVSNYLDTRAIALNQSIQFLSPSDKGESVLLPKQLLELPTATSSFYLAYKKEFTNGSVRRGGRHLIRQKLIGDLIVKMLIGDGSNTFEELYNDGIIDESFRLNYVVQEGYAHLIIWGDSMQAEAAVEKIAHTLEEFIRLGAFDERRLEEITRASIGSFLRDLDDVKRCGNLVAQIKSVNLEFSDYASIFYQLKGRELLDELQFMKEENRASVVIHGRKKRKN